MKKIGTTKTRWLSLFLGAVVLCSLATPVLAGWWIVRSSDGVCLVVDIDPTAYGEAVKNVGKDNYQTQGEAQADLKRVCDGS